MKKDEVDRNKNRAKALSRLHYNMRSKNNIQATGKNTTADATIGDTIRYEIKGESLRGMEYMTSITIGRKRRRVQKEATQATVVEQQEQLIQHVLDVCMTDNSSRARVEDQLKIKAMKMDHSKLAKVYGAKAQDALAYAQRVAQEDAKVAAEILAEDLQEQEDFPSSSRTSCSSSLVECSSVKRTHAAIYHNTESYSTGPIVTAEFIKTFLHRRRCLAAEVSLVQA